MGLETLESRQLLTATAGNDDFADSTDGEVCIVEPLAATSGTLELATDIDVFAVDVLAGRFYQIEFANPSIDSVAVDITGVGGVQIATGNATTPTIWKAETADRHFLSVSSSTGEVGDFSFTFEQVEDDHASHIGGATSVDVNSALEANISWPSNVDWFRYTAQAGIEYEIHVVPSEGLADMLVSISDEALNVLQSDSDGGAARLFLPTRAEAADFFVSVKSLSGRTGDYTFSVSAIEPQLFEVTPRSTDDSLELGVPNARVAQTIRRSIDEVDGVDRLSFRSVAGSHYYDVHVQPRTLNGHVVRLFDEAGNELPTTRTGNDVSHVTRYRSAGDEIITADVIAASGGFGSYDISVTVAEDDYPDTNVADAPRIEAGSSRTGFFEIPNDVEVMVFDAIEAEYYSIALEGAAIARVIGPGDVRVATLRTPRLPSTTFRIGQTGRHAIEVIPDAGTGAFSVSLDRIPVDDHPNDLLDVSDVLEPGTTAGQLETVDDRDVFTQSVQIGEKVEVGFSSEIAASLLILRDNAVQQIIRPGETVQISADEDAEIEFRVSSSQDETGTYSITYEPLEDDYPDIYLPSNREVLFGETITGTLENAADVDRLLIDLVEGERLNVELDWDGDSQPSVRVRSLSGRGEFSLSSTGQTRVGLTDKYEVLVRHTRGDTGAYSVTINEAFDDHPDRPGEGVQVVTWGDPIAGSVWNTDRDLFFVDAEAGDRVVTVSAHGDLDITIWNSDHTEQIPIDEVERGWDLPEPGRYVLDVRQDPSARFSTQYDFTLLNDDHPDTPVASATRLEAGVTLTGTMHIAREDDVFLFDFPPGLLTEFRVANAEDSSRNFSVSVRDELGNYVGQLDRGVFRIEEGGMHFVSLRSIEGDYEITAIINEPDDHPDTVPGADEPTTDVVHLVPGTPLIGKLGVRSDVDVFAIDSVAGKRYELSLTGSGDNPADDLSYTLLMADGHNELTSRAAAEGWISATEGTQYVSASGNAGTYSITLTESDVELSDDYGNTRATATPLEFGRFIHGTIEAVGDRDIFVFDAGPGTVLDAAFRTPFETVVGFEMQVWDAEGNSYPWNNGDWALLSPGRYYIEIFGSYARDYSMLFGTTTDQFPSSYPGELTDESPLQLHSLPDPIIGRLDFQGDTDWIPFSANAGESYRVTLSNLNFYRDQPTYCIMSPDGERALHCRNRDTPFVVPETGNYWLRVDGNSVTTGTYEVRFDPVFDLTTTRRPIPDVGFTWQLTEETDQYTLDLEAGQHVRLGLDPDFDVTRAVITVRFKGRLVTDCRGCAVEWVATETGTYDIDISPYDQLPVDEQFGPYRIVRSTPGDGPRGLARRFNARAADRRTGDRPYRAGERPRCVCVGRCGGDHLRGHRSLFICGRRRSRTGRA